MSYWDRVSITPGLSEEYIREHADHLNWHWISMQQTLSEDLIREFADRVDWFSISVYQTLSESFIREFADRVYWYWILKHQQISEEFALQHLLYFVKNEELWEYLPKWCQEKGWNLERLTEAREMVRLLR